MQPSARQTYSPLTPRFRPQPLPERVSPLSPDYKPFARVLRVGGQVRRTVAVALAKREGYQRLIRRARLMRTALLHQVRVVAVMRDDLMRGLRMPPNPFEGYKWPVTVVTADGRYPSVEERGMAIQGIEWSRQLRRPLPRTFPDAVDAYHQIRRETWDAVLAERHRASREHYAKLEAAEQRREELRRYLGRVDPVTGTVISDRFDRMDPQQQMEALAYWEQIRTAQGAHVLAHVRQARAQAAIQQAPTRTPAPATPPLPRPEELPTLADLVAQIPQQKRRAARR